MIFSVYCTRKLTQQMMLAICPNHMYVILLNECIVLLLDIPPAPPPPPPTTTTTLDICFIYSLTWLMHFQYIAATFCSCIGGMDPEI